MSYSSAGGAGCSVMVLARALQFDGLPFDAAGAANVLASSGSECEGGYKMGANLHRERTHVLLHEALEST